MGEVLIELAKSSPFGVMCIIFVLILNRTYTNNLKELRALHEKTIEEIKDAYQKVYASFEKRQRTKV